ncbi:MAG: pyrroloquinoline quinone biosynthesis protein PqqB [Acidobacteriaceae bacterium]|nr:pyrroloquinoline quinone biosynthesis protein PqqB [Acidobacteriaceae bacterium]
MHVRVLGAAAGGGFPQWNCSCSNCRRLRQGSLHGAPRSQAQLAISADGEDWFLLNASPDLRYQIESFPSLHPRPATVRHSPINGVVLTSAELDAALGLLLLRESQPLIVYATDAVRQLLVDDNNFFGVLRRRPDQVEWRSITPGVPFELKSIRGTATSIRCTAVSTGGTFPGHVPPQRARGLDPSGAVIGLFIEHAARRIAFFPGARTVEPEWLKQMSDCDAIFFDGTFWSDDELIRLQDHGSESQAKTARQMGHSPVFGPRGTLEKFSTLNGHRKIFIHINNTNPMLDEDSPEYRYARSSGWELAFDGMELSL